MLQVQVTLDTAAMFMAVLLITLHRHAAVRHRAGCSSAPSSCPTRGCLTAALASMSRALHPSRRRRQDLRQGREGAPGDFRRDLRRHAGRARLPGRALGLRQEHAAQDPRRPASARRRHGEDRLRRGAVRSRPGHRHGVPAAAAAEVANDRRQRPAAGRDPRPADEGEPRARARPARPRRPRRAPRTSAPTSSRAACSSARRSRARWSTTPSWC